MSASGQTHAEAIGLTGYATDASGIGGLVKTRVEDFRVEELSTKLSMDQRGRFTVARITLRNWETNRFIARLAKALGIPKERIFFAGTKDKRAITRQLFVIDAPANKVSGVELTDVDIEVLGRTHQKIGFGNHRGNRFTITVRGCAHPDGSPMSDEEAMAEIERIHTMLEQTLGAERFPNWIGPQRFGSGRPVTAEVGRHVIAGRFEDAVMAYLSMPGAGEAPDVAAFRARVREEGITEEVIEACPDWMDFERRMATHLLEKPDDHVGAFRRLPNNLQLMTVHALQSVVFNRSLHARLEEGLPLATPVEGDMVGRVDERGQLEAKGCVTVQGRTADRIARNCTLGRLTVTGPLPGSDVVTCEGRPGAIEAKVMEDMGLKDAMWTVQAIPRLSTKGTRRALVTGFKEFTWETVPKASEDTLDGRWAEGPTDGDRWHPEGACIKFRFTLSSGAYATTLLREFMMAPLNHLG